MIIWTTWGHVQYNFSWNGSDRYLPVKIHNTMNLANKHTPYRIVLEALPFVDNTFIRLSLCPPYLTNFQSGFTTFCYHGAPLRFTLQPHRYGSLKVASKLYLTENKKNFISMTWPGKRKKLHTFQMGWYLCQQLVSGWMQPPQQSFASPWKLSIVKEQKLHHRDLR